MNNPNSIVGSHSQVTPHTKEKSLGIQILMLSGGLLSILVVIIVWVGIYSQSKDLSEVFEKQGRALAFSLAISSATGVLENNYAELEALLVKNERFDSLEAATIADPKGNIIARVQRVAKEGTSELALDYNFTSLKELNIPIDIRQSTVRSEGNLLTIQEPIVAGDIVGQVFLNLDLAGNNAKIKALGIRYATTAFVLVAIALAVLYLFVQAPIRQLNHLTEFAKRMVSQIGLRNEEYYPSRELGTLNNTLNWASEELQRRTQTMQEATERADRSNELKSQFLANMSHEIRTPLNGIMGLSEIIMSSQELNKESRSNMEMIQISAENLLRVVNDILDFSKIEADKLDIDPHPFHLRQLIKSLINPMQTRKRSPDVNLISHIDPDVPDHLMGDAGRLSQIMVNLIGNSLKFTKKGQVLLRISCLDKTQSEQGETAQLLIQVIDTGKGIPKEVQNLIFDPFTQAESSTTRKHGGTGLGLSISQRLVRLMNGEISLQSEPGVGSEFSIRLSLPVLADLGQDAQTDVGLVIDTASKSVQPNKTSEASMEMAIRGIRVLVAEDNSVNQKFVSHVLSNLGLSFRIVSDGQQAVDAANEEKFDLILMDLHMPVMGGLDATRAIIAKDPNQLIVGLTADAIAGTREACLEAGMREYLSKPFKKAEVEAMLDKLNLPWAPLPMNNFDQDIELMKATAEAVVSEMPKLLEVLDSAVEANDLKVAHRTVHTLKGHVKLFGDTKLGELLQNSEKQLLDGKPIDSIHLGFLKKNLGIFKERIELLIH